jgi:hypothetical protein
MSIAEAWDSNPGPTSGRLLDIVDEYRSRPTTKRDSRPL